MGATEEEAFALSNAPAATPDKANGHESVNSGAAFVLALSGHGLKLVVKGELDMAGAPRLAAALDALAEMANVHVVLDLSELSFMDCAGLTVLITAARELDARGGRLSLQRPRRPVWRLLLAAGAEWLVEGNTGQAADEARAAVGLSREELYWRFFALGGNATRTQFEFFLDGLSGRWDRLELVTLLHALDERHIELGLPLLAADEVDTDGD